MNCERTKSKLGLPDLVCQWYYKHGLFLSSYPTCATSIAIVTVLVSCYPLLNIPLPGTIPTKIILPYETSGDKLIQTDSSNFSLVNNIFTLNNITFDQPFPWAQSKPFLYIQQIILRAGVFPWTDEMLLMDAFRAPLNEVFKLLEIIRNHECEERKVTLDHICLHIGNIKQPQKRQVFPEYNCLILSPANFWGQDIHNFSKDDSILDTIFQYHNLQKTKVSVAEMFFGLPMQDTGCKRYPLRSRVRVIQYAITLVLKENDKPFLNSLRNKLNSIYPLQQDQKSDKKASVMYIYYPGEFKLLEFMPICTAFIVLFIYVYFSVRKIEIIRSRVILALCAVLTVLGSLMMSLGLCFFFGLTISLQSKGIFPYLVILVGLENSLVITKSVVSTDEAFDIKIRVAQGLSREGWHISKTLLTEITILTVGLGTFVPVIQEFCVFAIVGLISDFFLQMLLFSTILAMDIKRMEYTAEVKQIPKMLNNTFNDIGKRKPDTYIANSPKNKTFSRSHSQPKLSIQDIKNAPSDSATRPSVGNIVDQKIPKRLKLVNFWARTRFFQRAFMIWMSVWIFSIIYNSDFLESFLVMDANSTSKRFVSPTLRTSSSYRSNLFSHVPNKNINEPNKLDDVNVTEQIKKLQFPDFEVGYFLSNFHWAAILRQYNISLSGKYVTILPAIKLSQLIKPEVAILLRNPKEKFYQNFQWKALAAALDPLDFNDDDIRKPTLALPGGTPLYPKSPMEIFLATMLCAISVFVLTYTMIVFYRCICTRNYAEWRSSWNEYEVVRNTEEILEGIPIKVKGHKHKIECLVSDGVSVASSCLQGKIKVWDAKSGELLSKINRSKVFQDHTYHQINANTALEHDEYVPRKQEFNVSPIWCLDFLDNLLAVGCANGKLEFWEAPTGLLKCTHHDTLKQGQGVTHISLSSDRVIVARLCGRLDFYRLETYYKGKQIDWGFTSAYRRTHVRTGSTGSMGTDYTDSLKYLKKDTKEEMKCHLEEVRLAHQQPITCMEVVNGIVFTGSQDHTLKVYHLVDLRSEVVLHGHCGPITCLFIDKWQHGTGGSGSQDGLLCVWDLFTGACMYNIQAHDGSVNSLVCAPSYVISLGTDERICAWERFQGNLLTTINISNAYSTLLMLTPSLLVTNKIGSITVWDVRSGEPTREVKLGCTNSQLCPKIMILASSSVICDYGNQLRIVRFPMVADKCN